METWCRNVMKRETLKLSVIPARCTSTRLANVKIDERMRITHTFTYRTAGREGNDLAVPAPIWGRFDVWGPQTSKVDIVLKTENVQDLRFIV